MTRAQPVAPERPPRAHRSRRLALLALLGGGLLVLRRRRTSRQRSAVAERPAPTRPASGGPTGSAIPTLSDRLAAGAVLPGHPRLAAVHGRGALPHDEVGATLLEVALPVGRVVVGRAPDADVRLDDETVSPHHAVLDVAADGTVRVQDVGALNGLAVDGVPVAHALLHDGNRLDVGDSSLVFRCDPPGDDGGRQGGELGEQPHHAAEGRD